MSGPANATSPQGMCGIDQVNNVAHGIGNARYSIGGTGTTTLKAGPGIYYGVKVLGTGTGGTYTVLDGTQAIDNGLTAALGVAGIGPGGVGARVNTSLVFVLAGSVAPTVTVLWD